MESSGSGWAASTPWSSPSLRWPCRPSASPESTPSPPSPSTDRPGRVTASRGYKGALLPSIAAFTRGGSGIAASSGKFWRHVRSRLEANISRKYIAVQHEPIVTGEVESVVKALRESCEGDQPSLVACNLTSQLKRESMNVALQLLFSQRFKDDTHPDFVGLKHAVEYFFNCLVTASAPFGMFPWLEPAAGLVLADFIKEVKKRDVVLERIIAGRREGFDQLVKDGTIHTDEAGEAVGCRDLCDLFFWDQSQGRLDEDQVFVVLWDILFAMTDTTASTNEWMIFYLVNHPQVQAKLHAELDRVVGPDRLPCLADKDQLPYLWATVKEVMRIRLVSPMMFTHFADESLTVRDEADKQYTIPAGTMLHLHGYAMAHDAALWGDPQKFRPERWLEDSANEGLDLHGKENRRLMPDHFKFIPFSMGPRTCPGYSFAQVAVFLQAATIMHCFSWELSPRGLESEHVTEGQLDLTENGGLTIMPRRYADDGLIKAVPRKCNGKEPARLAKDQPPANIVSI